MVHATRPSSDINTQKVAEKAVQLFRGTSTPCEVSCLPYCAPKEDAAQRMLHPILHCTALQ